MGECPGPIHSDLPFLCNNPELPACLTAKPAKVLTTEGNLREAGWLRTRSSESQGLHTAFFPHLWKFLDVFSPRFRIPGFHVRQEIMTFNALWRFFGLPKDSFHQGELLLLSV